MAIQQELEKIKKGQIAPVYLVHGTETYLNEKVKAVFLTSILQSEETEFNFVSFDMENVLVDQAIEEALSAPFFGDKKVLFLENTYFLTSERGKNDLEHDLKWLEEYLQNPNPETTMVLFAPYEKLDQRKGIVKKVLKQTTKISTSSFNEKEIIQYVKNMCVESGYIIEHDALSLLIKLKGAHLSDVLNELNKLMLYAIDEKKITKKIVSELTVKGLEENVFELTDLVLKKKTSESLLLFQSLIIQKEEPIKIIALLLSQFRLLLQVKILRSKGYTQGDMATVLKVHPYRVKLAMQQETKFSQIDLATAYKTLIDTDYHLKTGQGDAYTQFELFILSFTSNYKRSAGFSMNK